MHLKGSQSRKPTISATIRSPKQSSPRAEESSTFSRTTRWNFGFNSSRRQDRITRTSPLKIKMKPRPKTSIEHTRETLFQEWDTVRSLTHSRDRHSSHTRKIKDNAVRRHADRRRRIQSYTVGDKRNRFIRPLENPVPPSIQSIPLDEYEFPSTESKAAFSIYDGNNKNDIRGSFFRKNRHIQTLHSRASTKQKNGALNNVSVADVRPKSKGGTTGYLVYCHEHKLPATPLGTTRPRIHPNEIVMSNQRMTREHGSAVAKGFESMSRSNEDIRVDLSNNALGSSLKEILDSLRNHFVTKLILDRTEVSTKMLAKEVGNFISQVNIIEASLQSCRMPDTAFQALLQALSKCENESNAIYQLETLQTRRLNFSKNRIKSTSMAPFVNILISKFQNLTHLDLSSNLISQSGGIQICTWMSRRTCVLRYLNLSFNNLGDGHLVEEVRKGNFGSACEKALRLSRTILHLVLTATMLTLKDLESIAKGVDESVSLLCVHLDGNECFYTKSNTGDSAINAQKPVSSLNQDPSLKVVEQLRQRQTTKFCKIVATVLSMARMHVRSSKEIARVSKRISTNLKLQTNKVEPAECSNEVNCRHTLSWIFTRVTNTDKSLHDSREWQEVHDCYVCGQHEVYTLACNIRFLEPSICHSIKRKAAYYLIVWYPRMECFEPTIFPLFTDDSFYEDKEKDKDQNLYKQTNKRLFTKRYFPPGRNFFCFRVNSNEGNGVNDRSSTVNYQYISSHPTVVANNVPKYIQKYTKLYRINVLDIEPRKNDIQIDTTFQKRRNSYLRLVFVKAKSSFRNIVDYQCDSKALESLFNRDFESIKLKRIVSKFDDFENLRLQLKQNYYILLGIFSYYTSLGNDTYEDSLRYLKRVQYDEFLKDIKIDVGLDKIKEDIDILYAASCYHEKNYGDSQDKIRKYLYRPSFMESALRLAKLLYPTISLNKSLRNLISNNLKYAKSHAQQRDQFRQKYVYIPETDAFMKHKGETFQEIFERQSSMQHLPIGKGKLKALIKLRPIYELYKRSNILHVYFGIRELRNIYRQSLGEDNEGLNYSEFLDFICRSAIMYNCRHLKPNDQASCERVQSALLHIDFKFKPPISSWIELLEEFAGKLREGMITWQ